MSTYHDHARGVGALQLGAGEYEWPCEPRRSGSGARVPRLTLYRMDMSEIRGAVGQPGQVLTKQANTLGVGC